MEKVRVAQYARFLDRDGNYITGYAYQNFFVNETRTWEDAEYGFAAFLFSGSLGGGAGESKEANILGTPNKLTVPIFSEVVEKFWLVEIKRVMVTYDTDTLLFSESQTITSETWNCSACPRDGEQITIRLGDPFDAVQSQASRRRLTASLVGALPSTGNISLR